MLDEVALYVLNAHHLAQAVGPRGLEQRVLAGAGSNLGACVRAARLLLAGAVAGAGIDARRGAVTDSQRPRAGAPRVVQKAAAAMRQHERPVAVREVVRDRRQEHLKADEQILREKRFEPLI